MFLGYSWVHIKRLVKPDASLESGSETWPSIFFALLQDSKLLVAVMQSPTDRLYIPPYTSDKMSSVIFTLNFFMLS